MNLVLKNDQFNIECVQFMKTRKNIIMENSLFIKMLYSDENMVMNSIFIEFPVKPRDINRNLLFYQPSENEALLQQMAQIERDILSYYRMIHLCDKTEIHLMTTQLERGNIKFNYIPSTASPIVHEKFVMKISGIWENSDTLGLNYKLFVIPTYLKWLT